MRSSSAVISARALSLDVVLDGWRRGSRLTFDRIDGGGRGRPVALVRLVAGAGVGGAVRPVSAGVAA